MSPLSPIIWPFEASAEWISRRHVILCSLHNAGSNLALQEAPRKPLTVNWRDIQATIHGQPSRGSKSTQPTASVDSDHETTSLKHPDPVQDGLNWLDEGHPDLRSSTSTHFDLAAEFDIERYLHILADRVDATERSDGPTSTREVARKMDEMSSKAAADSVVPKEDEWGSWA